MRIAQLVETLGVGGAEKLVLDIAGAFAGAGDASCIIVLNGPGPLSERVPAGVPVHYLDLDRSRRGSYLQVLGRLHRLTSDLALDALQCHLPMANFFGLTLALRGRTRIFPTVHNNREFDYGATNGLLRPRLRKFAYRRMVDRCRRMVAVSQAVKEAMVEALGLRGTRADRIVVVPNGVPIPEPVTAEVRAGLRQDLGLVGEERLIVGVGRLSAQKNFQDLVEALTLLPTDGVPWRCLIAGDGNLKGDLADRIEAAGLSRRITLAGHVSDIPGLLQAADIFCLPSLWEGLPLALLEAMAAGLPVVAYRIDGVSEVVIDGEHGCLADKGRNDQLAAGLERLLADPEAAVRLGRAGRHLVTERFGFTRVAESLREIYTG